MKGTLAFALPAALVAGAAFAPLPVGGRFAVKSLHQQLEARTGLSASAETADVRFTLLPFPKVRFANLRIAAPDGAPIARIGALDAYLRPLDLVGGRLRYSGYALSDPVVDASSDATRAAWREAGRRLMRSDPSATPPLGQVVIQRGALLPGPDPATDIAARIAWNGGDAPLSAWISGRWKGEAAELRLSEVNVDALLTGLGRTPARVSVRTPFATFEGVGDFVGGASPSGATQVRLVVSSASGLQRWLGAPTPLAGLIERYSFQGAVEATASGLSAPAATITAGDSRFEGSVALRFDAERPILSGTLAAAAIDFDALSAPIDALRHPAGPWNADPFDTAPLARTDLDVRLSATRIRALGAVLADAALSIQLTGGRLELVLARAQAYQGALRGRASIQGLDSARVEARLQATFDNLDVGAALQDLTGGKPLSGLGQGHLQIEASGGSPMELARQLSGKMALQLRDGDIAGVNLPDAVRRPARLIESGVALGRGRTPFATFDVAATLAQGLAEVGDATLANGSLRAQASGEVSIRDQSARLGGRISAPGLASDGLPFTLQGPWRMLDLRWDPTAVFRRSRRVRPARRRRRA